MISFFPGWFFNTTQLPFQGDYQAIGWTKELEFVYIFSAFLIFLSYISIPLSLIYFVAKRKNFSFPRLSLLFSGFIILCGLSQLTDAFLFLYSWTLLSTTIKAVTAFISVAVALMLTKFIPARLTLPSLDSMRQHLTWLVEWSDLAILSVDLENNVISCNKSAEKIFQVKSAEIIGNSLSLVFPTYLDERTLKLLQRLILHGKNITLREFTITSKMGNPQHLFLTSSPIKNSSKEIVGCSLMFKDLTHQKNLETLLVENNERLFEANKILAEKAKKLDIAQKFHEDFYENAPDMFLSICTTTRHIYQCNETLCQVLGYTKEELYSRPIFNLFHRDCLKKTFNLHKKFLKEGIISNETIVLVKKDGTTLPVSVNATAIYDEQEKEVIAARVCYRDITTLEETKKLVLGHQKNLEIANKALKYSNEKLDFFASLASHDLKSPLRSIGFLAHMAKKEIEEKNNSQSHEMLDKISERVIKMGNMLDDMLHYCRAASTNHEVEVIDIKKLINNISELLGNPKKIVLNFKEDIPSFKAQRFPLQQVLQNLISNALKHHHQPDNILIKITVEDKKEKVLFSVKDNGPGIPKQYHTKIFEMFQTVNTSPTLTNDSGLGLAMVKKIIENHSGEINVISEENKGAIFEFSWAKGN